MSRRSFLHYTGLAAVSTPLLAACGGQGGGGAAAGGKGLSMQLGFLLDNGQLGEAVALGKGWYADNGIDFSFKPGGPSIDGIAMVAGGQSQVGQVSSSPSLMLAVSQGVPIKAFAAGVQQHPYAYFSRPEKPVRTPADLAGKKVGVQATGKVLMSALLAKNGIPEKEVEVVAVGADVTPLTTGQVDVWTGWLSNVAALRPLNGRYVAMRLWDAGIRLYANPYYATTRTLEQDSAKLQKFVSATAAGWKYARENVDEAVALLVKNAPTLKAADMKAQAEVLLKYTFDQTTAAQGWGAMDKTLWQQQLDMWAQLKQFKGTPPTVDKVATTAVLDATAGTRPKLG
ncbi:ABC transporter substrate-binding protein [Actinomadura vinacea]